MSMFRRKDKHEAPPSLDQDEQAWHYETRALACVSLVMLSLAAAISADDRHLLQAVALALLVSATLCWIWLAELDWHKARRDLTVVLVAVAATTTLIFDGAAAKLVANLLLLAAIGNVIVLVANHWKCKPRD